MSLLAMRCTCILLLSILLTGCIKVDIEADTLRADIDPFGSKIVVHGVIACAANSMALPNSVEVYFYPPDGVTHMRVYCSNSPEEDEWDYNNYSESDHSVENLFDGYLKKYSLPPETEEKWAIVTFERDDTVFLSDPVRLRHLTFPTEMNGELITVVEQATTPSFSWTDGIYTTNDIYFQVITDTLMNFISGTYTRDRSFQFYDLTNVVLDINEGNIPVLLPNSSYDFTLMAVDDDNWVNLLCWTRFSTD